MHCLQLLSIDFCLPGGIFKTKYYMHFNDFNGGFNTLFYSHSQ